MGTDIIYRLIKNDSHGDQGMISSFIQTVSSVLSSLVLSVTLAELINSFSICINISIPGHIYCLTLHLIDPFEGNGTNYYFILTRKENIHKWFEFYSAASLHTESSLHCNFSSCLYYVCCFQEGKIVSLKENTSCSWGPSNALPSQH